jgi:Na+/H+ antiporter NhaD/arsenite permease-like protein
MLALESHTSSHGSTYWLAATLFVLTFGAIVSEKVHKTKAALFGGAAAIALGVLSQEEAFHSPHYGNFGTCALATA